MIGLTIELSHVINEHMAWIRGSNWEAFGSKLTITLGKNKAVKMNTIVTAKRTGLKKKWSNLKLSFWNRVHAWYAQQFIIHILTSWDHFVHSLIWNIDIAASATSYAVNWPVEVLFRIEWRVQLVARWFWRRPWGRFKGQKSSRELKLTEHRRQVPRQQHAVRLVARGLSSLLRLSETKGDKLNFG